MNWKPYLSFFGVGVLTGICLIISFHVQWTEMHADFYFWASLIMTLISVLLAGLTIWQYRAAEVERKKGDAQVKIWMQDANGLYEGLRTISVNCFSVLPAPAFRYSSVQDAGMAIYSLANSAQALYQSLYEERCVTEEQYRTQQRELGEVRHAQQLQKIQNDGKTVVPTTSPAHVISTQ